MKTIRLLLLIATILIITGCSYSGPKTSPDKGTTLVNTYWKLISIDDREITTPADAKEVHLILRPDYRVTGFGGCNTFSGTWQMEEDQLVVGPLMSTMMACPDMETEQSLLSGLDGRVITEIEGETLNLMGREGIELVFQAVYFQ